LFDDVLKYLVDLGGFSMGF